MGRHSTIPDLFNDCKTINISKLKMWGYLNPYVHKSGTVTWSRRGEVIGTIGLMVDMDHDYGTMALSYVCDKEQIKYEVELISKKANLGFGQLWFFVCPDTGKHCRILHLGQKYFLHRTSFKGYMYESQTWSSNTRYLAKTPMYLDIKADNIYDQIYAKHFKKYYNGKPTKRYFSLLKKIGEKAIAKPLN